MFEHVFFLVKSLLFHTNCECIVVNEIYRGKNEWEIYSIIEIVLVDSCTDKKEKIYSKISEFAYCKSHYPIDVWNTYLH